MTREIRSLAGYDPYDLLGIGRDASTEDIGRAFKEQIKIWHPDLCRTDQARAAAAERTQLLNSARLVLLTQRAQYDSAQQTPDVEDPWDDVPADPWDDIPTPSSDPWEKVPPPPPPTFVPPQPWVHANYPTMPPPSFNLGYMPPVRPTNSRKLIVRGLSIGCGGCLVAIGLMVTAVLFSAWSKPEFDPMEPKVAIPKAFAGTWTGEVRMKKKGKASGKIRIILPEGKARGSYKYLTNSDCADRLIPWTYSSGTLTLMEYTPSCLDTMIELTLRKNGKLGLTNLDMDGETATAVLTRAKRK